MKLRLEKEPIIDNLRNHSPETVEKLRDLLITGAPARLDPHRKNFYELENCSQVYYIHLSPANNKVMFLAVWDKDGVEETTAEHISEALFSCSANC